MLKPRKKRLVLDVGTSSMRLAELSPTKEGYQLSKYYQKEVIVDPALSDDDKLEVQLEALNALLKEAKVRRRKAVIAVPGQSVFTRNRPLPPVPEHKVPQIVRYEIQQQIPFSLDQIALDYVVLNRNEAGGYEVMMAAIKVDVVEKQLELIKRAKCGIEIVDVSPLAAYNWLEHTGEFGDDGQCVAFVDFGATTTDIVIRKDSQFKFTRSLHTGGNDVTQAVAREFNMSFEEAERVKRERGFAPTGDAKRDGKGGEVIGRVLNRLVGEINRSIAFFRSQPGGGPVNRVILAGGGACMRNIVPYLQSQLGIEVRIAQPLAGLAVSPNAQAASEHPEQSCIALGLALRVHEEPKLAINLIPPRVKEMGRQREQLMYWALTMVSLVLILGARVPLTAKNEELARERIDKLKRVLIAYDPALAANPGRRSALEDEFEFVKNDVGKLMSDVVFLDALRWDRGTWIEELIALNDAKPRAGGIVFQSITTAVFGGRSNTGQPYRDVLTDSAGNQSSSDDDAVIYAPRSSIEPFATGTTMSASQQPPPNGFVTFGYATDLETLKLFVERLEASGKFVNKGVYWDRPYTEQAPASKVDPRAHAEETVIQFHIDVQFAGDPLPPSE